MAGGYRFGAGRYLAGGTASNAPAAICGRLRAQQNIKQTTPEELTSKANHQQSQLYSTFQMVHCIAAHGAFEELAGMKVTVLAGMMAFAAPAYAAPAELPLLPFEMTGFWEPVRHLDIGWPRPMQRIPKDAYEWEVRRTKWLEWDGLCEIHDIKQLGEMDYEVEPHAVCLMRIVMEKVSNIIRRIP